jgi:hypothetical protein
MEDRREDKLLRDNINEEFEIQIVKVGKLDENTAQPYDGMGDIMDGMTGGM